MKLAHTIAALSVAAAVGGLGMTVPVHAQTTARRSYCDQNPEFGSDNCVYHSMRRCLRFALPNGGWCSVNQSTYQPSHDGMANRY